MADDILQRLSEALSRRKFLARTATAFLGTAYGVLGLPQQAAALCSSRGCNLCYCPVDYNPCGIHPPYCIWSWPSCYQGTLYMCNEWYCGNGGNCQGGCYGVTGSTVTVAGSC